MSSLPPLRPIITSQEVTDSFDKLSQALSQARPPSNLPELQTIQYFGTQILQQVKDLRLQLNAVQNENQVLVVCSCIVFYPYSRLPTI